MRVRKHQAALTARAVVVSSRAINSPTDRLGSLALLHHACHVTVRVKCYIMSALFECLRAAFVEDHLVADVIIALIISFQLSLGRMYHRCRARCVVVALRLGLHRPRERQSKYRCQEQLFADIHLEFSLVLPNGGAGRMRVHPSIQKFGTYARTLNLIQIKKQQTHFPLLTFGCPLWVKSRRWGHPQAMSAFPRTADIR